MSCTCPKPVQSLNTSRYGDMCVKCGKRVIGEWVADDDTMGEFYDRLAEGMNLGVDLDPSHPFECFRRQALNREIAGRTHPKGAFGYLDRDNALEATEEAADLGNYCAFEEMRDRRAGLAPDVDLMMAAMFAAKAHECLLRHRARRRGTPFAVEAT